MTPGGQAFSSVSGGDERPALHASFPGPSARWLKRQLAEVHAMISDSLPGVASAPVGSGFAGGDGLFLADTLSRDACLHRSRPRQLLLGQETTRRRLLTAHRVAHRAGPLALGGRPWEGARGQRADTARQGGCPLAAPQLWGCGPRTARAGPALRGCTATCGSTR